MALLATVARWMLISRVPGWSVLASARPFLRIAPITAVSTIIGVATLELLGARAWAGPLVAVVAAVVALAVYVGLLRLLASHVIRTALAILPVPQRYATRIGRVLGVGRAPAAGPL